MGNRVAVACDDETAIIFNALTGKRLSILKGHTDEGWGVDYSPGGKYLATTSKDETAKVWDLASGKCLFTLKPLSRTKPRQNYCWRAKFHPDGTSIITAHSDGTAKIWNAANGQLDHTIKAGHTAITCRSLQL